MDVVARALVAFCFIFLLTRLIGRRELSSLQPFDLILLIVMGDLVQQGVTQNDLSITGLILTIGLFGVLTLGASYVGFRFPRFRPILEPEPLILIEDGNVIERNLKKERMTQKELASEARLQQIDSLEKVKWAVLESGGQISFIPKSS
ncbi:MAG: DUF421 domain-containing protein [Actinobacteria bacterium]|jgi:uncharacterized membrane protein YcaP (DUF421 family)|nr:MAG: DUF421 domain-containing protein [Actinomycetota bacterium]